MKTKKQGKKLPRILIVDDRLSERLSIGMWFEDAGCKVSTAENSREAETILDNHVDIALIDFDLGSERGIDLAKKIKKRYSKVLVYLMTASPKSTFCFRSSFREIQCIEKTLRPEQFVPVIMNFWEIEHQQGELEQKTRSINDLLPFKNLITGLHRNTKNPMRESITGRLEDPEGRDTRFVVYDEYVGHGDTIDICIAVLYGCLAGCLHCFFGLFRTNVRQLKVVEMISQVLHGLTSVHAKNWQNRKICISTSNEGDFIYNWKKVWRLFIILFQTFGSQISFVISTIGNVRIFKQFIKAYKEYPERLPVRIYWSLHTLIQDLREWFLPGTEGQSIDETIELLLEFAKLRDKKVTIQWLLIIGFNDSPEDIEMIIKKFNGLWEWFDVKVMPFSDQGKKNYLAPYGFIIPATIEDADYFALELVKRGAPARSRIDCGIYDDDPASMGNTGPNFGGFRPTS